MDEDKNNWIKALIYEKVCSWGTKRGSKGWIQSEDSF